jgi:hypothetical protein
LTEILDSRRLELVQAAQQQWIAALTDLGGRNTLLYYKDRRAGTLDLAHADPEALDRFTRTGSTRLTYGPGHGGRGRPAGRKRPGGRDRRRPGGTAVAGRRGTKQTNQPFQSY